MINPQINTTYNHHPNHEVENDQQHQVPLHPCPATGQEITVLTSHHTGS